MEWCVGERDITLIYLLYRLCCVVYKNGVMKEKAFPSGHPQMTRTGLTFNAAYTRQDSNSPSLDDEVDENQQLLKGKVNL